MAESLWPPESTILHTQRKGHAYLASPFMETTSPENNKPASKAASHGNPFMSASKQAMPEQIKLSPNQSSTRKTELLILSTARSLLRTDYIKYLEAELPRWANGGLWSHKTSKTKHPTTATTIATTSTPDFRDLQLVYSEVCKLHTRMEDDAIRSRIALIRLHLEYLKTLEGWQKRHDKGRIGRGEATCIIDQILRLTHSNRATLSKAQCNVLRAQFHERKRYGKRWAVLVDRLGKSILFLCSAKVMALV